MTQPIHALLFDLGGVVIEIDFDRALHSWAEHSRHDVDGLRERFAFDDAYQQHERGQLDGVDYLQHLRRTLDLEADDKTIARGWNAIFVGAIPDAVAKLAALAPHVPCYAFTNTNAIHQAEWSVTYRDVVAHFRHVFVSSDMGVRKPEARAFRLVEHTIGVPAANILFLDDTLENVEGARAAGMQSAHTPSPASVVPVLDQAGF